MSLMTYNVNEIIKKTMPNLLKNKKYNHPKLYVHELCVETFNENSKIFESEVIQFSVGLIIVFMNLYIFSSLFLYTNIFGSVYDFE
ncbi:hypothetical protein NUSPORA_01773 [Nucleospora cyclopteri]